jgi:hypothetical protein
MSHGKTRRNKSVETESNSSTKSSSIDSRSIESSSKASMYDKIPCENINTLIIDLVNKNGIFFDDILNIDKMIDNLNDCNIKKMIVDTLEKYYSFLKYFNQNNYFLRKTPSLRATDSPGTPDSITKGTPDLITKKDCGIYKNLIEKLKPYIYAKQKLINQIDKIDIILKQNILKIIGEDTPIVHVYNELFIIANISNRFCINFQKEYTSDNVIGKKLENLTKELEKYYGNFVNFDEIEIVSNVLNKIFIRIKSKYNEWSKDKIQIINILKNAKLQYKSQRSLMSPLHVFRLLENSKTRKNRQDTNYSTIRDETKQKIKNVLNKIHIKEKGFYQRFFKTLK